MQSVIVSCYRESNALQKDSKVLSVPDSHDEDAIHMLHDIQLKISEKTTEIQYIYDAQESITQKTLGKIGEKDKRDQKDNTKEWRNLLEKVEQDHKKDNQDKERTRKDKVKKELEVVKA
jgi:hypothetical protein